MRRSRFALALAAAGALVAAGCGDEPTPTSPSSTTGATGSVTGGVNTSPLPAGAPTGEAAGVAEAAAVGEGVVLNTATVVTSAPDGSTLKADAPDATSPANGVVLPGLTVELVATNSDGIYVSTTFTYRFELYLASAAPGSLPLFAGTAQQGDDTTSLVVPVELQQGKDYKWRVRPERDARFGPWSDYAMFSTPILATIDPPIPTDPVNGAENVREPIIIQVTNGATTGTLGTIIMTFEIATDPSFVNIVDTIMQPAGMHDFTGTGKTGSNDPNRLKRTSVQPSVELTPLVVHYWRAKASDDQLGVSSGYSPTFSFTPADPNAAPSGGGGGLGFVDVWLHTDVSGWAQTSTVTNFVIGAPPICVGHSMQNSWPAVSIDGVPVNANVWVTFEIGGVTYAGTWEFFRPGQSCKGLGASDLGPHIKVPPGSSWTPKSGENVCMFVSGLARGSQRNVSEVSDVVCQPWP